MIEAVAENYSYCSLVSHVFILWYSFATMESKLTLSVAEMASDKTHDELFLSVHVYTVHHEHFCWGQQANNTRSSILYNTKTLLFVFFFKYEQR